MAGQGRIGTPHSPKAEVALPSMVERVADYDLRLDVLEKWLRWTFNDDTIEVTVSRYEVADLSVHT